MISKIFITFVRSIFSIIIKSQTYKLTSVFQILGFQFNNNPLKFLQIKLQKILFLIFKMNNKTTWSAIFSLFFTSFIFAQTPTGFNVQGVTAAPCDIATGCFGINSLINFDFESGNTNFTTSYTPNNGTATCTTGANCNGQYLCGQGYAIGNSATPCNPTWSANIRDHTTGVGKMMLIDFPASGSQDIWCQNINLLPNTNYCFGAYYINLMPLGNTTGQPIFEYTLNGASVATTPAIPATEQWEFSGFDFNSGLGGNVTLCIRNSNAGAIGFDAAIDDINLRQITIGTPPIAADDNLVLCTGTTIKTVNVLANDLAASGNLDFNTLRINQQPPFNQGVVSVNQALGEVTFTAAAGFAAPTSFEYQICNTTGCCATATVNVTQAAAPPTLTITPSPGANVCANKVLTLNATTGFTSYSWSPNVLNTAGTTATNTAIPANPNPAVPTPITYSVTATDANSCTATSSVIITVTPSPSTSVGLTVVPSPPVCSGVNVTFTANDNGTGGASPSYQWKINGVNAGNNSPVFVASLLNNGDVVGVLMTSSQQCANVAFQSAPPVIIVPTNIPSVALTASNTTICSGDNVMFTATPTNGGSLPVYTWYLNNVAISGATTANYSSTTLVDNDVIRVEMTPNVVCSQPTTIASQSLTMTVNQSGILSLTVAPPATPICQNSLATFTAAATSAGSSPTYQWQVNGVNAGTNSPNFSSNILNNNDIISCTVTSSAVCTPGTITQSVPATIITPVSPQIQLTTPSPSVCSGSFVVFNAVNPLNEGTNPIYTWLVNGIAQSIPNSSSFSSSSLTSSDVIVVKMISDLTCAVNNPATSNSLSVTVLPTVTPTLTVNNLTPTLCSGQTAFFNATITNGGTTPSFQWQVNGINVGTNDPFFNTNTINNGDLVSCILTSSLSCATAAQVLPITVPITQSVTPAVAIIPSAVQACAGQDFTFTAAGVNTGPTPSFVWFLNGVQTYVGNIYSPTNLAHLDNISVVMTTTAVCPTNSTANASQVIQVQTLSPTVSIIYPDTCKQGVGHALALPNGSAMGLTYTYAWSNAETTDTAKTLIGNKKYTVTITDNLGCQDTAAVFMPLIPGAKIDKVLTTSQTCGVNGELLDGSAAPLMSNPHLPQTYKWYDYLNNQLPVSDSLQSLTAGIYTVLVTDRSGCTTSATAVVPPPIYPNVVIHASDREITLGDSVSLSVRATASDILTYQWNPLPSYCTICKYIKVAPLQSTVYTVTVTNLANCTATTTIDIQVRETYEVYIPNIFTPNNDALNDYFTINAGPNVDKINYIQIFDRWGEMVFGQNNIPAGDYKTSWDGNFKDKKAPLGTYVYRLEIQYVDGKKRQFVGDIMVLY